MNRTTGRTYRRCLQACGYASSGKKVLFAVGNLAELNEICNRIDKLLPAGIPRTTPTSNFHFPGGGKISVRLVGSNLTGAKYEHVVTDELSGMNWRTIEPVLETLKNITR